MGCEGDLRNRVASRISSVVLWLSPVYPTLNLLANCVAEMDCPEAEATGDKLAAHLYKLIRS